MADWLHCNKCFVQPSITTSSTFYLTNCSHILCSKCYDYSVVECKKSEKPLQCIQCLKPQIKVMLINSSMDKKIRKFFISPDQLWQQNVTKIIKIYQFQSKQVQSLVKFAKQKENDSYKLKLENESLKKQQKTFSTNNYNAANRSFSAISPRDLFNSSENRILHNRSMDTFKRTSSIKSYSSASSARLISLDSPIAFSGRGQSSFLCTGNNSSYPSLSSNFQPSKTLNIKPTILASYSASSKSSFNSSSSVTSAAKSVLMSGKITKGSVLPQSTSRTLKSFSYK